MAKVAFVFPGQGSQAVGHGQGARRGVPRGPRRSSSAPTTRSARTSPRMCFEGPEEALKLTANTQPADPHRQRSPRMPSSRSACGRAPGVRRGPFARRVLARWSAAGALRLEDAVRAVRQRGTVHAGGGARRARAPWPRSSASSPSRSGRPARRRAQGEVVAPANYNSPEQTVIAGDAAAVERAGARLQGARRQAGAAAPGERALPLRADGAGAAAPARGARRDGDRRPGGAGRHQRGGDAERGRRRMRRC